MRALVLQHVEAESCGLVGESLARSHVSIDVVRVDRGESIPSSMGSYRALVVMGGPMGVYELERYPHLQEERALIAQAVRTNLPVLGICLGSQLLASALGAGVRSTGSQEIGWHEVRTTEGASTDPLFAHAPPTFVPWHWHGDAFDLPEGAVALASSAATVHQAFRHGNSWGILFHLEATRAIVDSMIEGFGHEADAQGTSLPRLSMDADASLRALAPIASGVFDAFALRVVSESPVSTSGRSALSSPS